MVERLPTRQPLDLEASGKTSTVARLAEANPWNNGASASIRTAN
jgi:hypothetical protein